MTQKEKLEELEQRIYELECVLKHYPKPFDIPVWMKPYEGTSDTHDDTIDVEWDWVL